MLHLGDITKLSGYTAPIVDCIIGGSPCQDLSLAGKRAGLDGERSGLYNEQIRIVKEMRERDRRNGRTGVDIRPRYMVWENVPGAFSSNKSEDFRVVLEELAKIKDENAVIPQPPNGKWRTSGGIMGDGWSIAWRVLDTQFWGLSNYLVDGSVIIPGTPQRRKRIALVADFGGQSAPEILFVRKSLSGNIDESEQTRKETSSDASRGIRADDRTYCFEPGAAKRLGGYVWEGIAPTLRTEVGDNRPSVAYTLKIRSGCEGGGKGALVQEDLSGILATSNDQYLFQPVCYGIGAYDSKAMKSDNPHSGIYEADKSRTLDMNGGNPTCNQGGIAIVQGVDVYNQALTGDKAKTLNSAASDADHIPCVVLDDQGGSQISVRKDGKSPTLRAEMHGNVPCVMDVYSIENHANDSRVDINERGIVQTLSGRMGTGGGNVPMVMCMATQQGGAEITENLCPTITAAAGMSGNNQTVAVYEKTVALEGNGQRPSHRGDGYSVTDKSYTLNSTEVHGVVYAVDQGGGKSQANVSENLSPTLTCTHGGEPVIALDRASFNQGQNAQFDFEVSDKGINSPLVAKGPSAVCYAPNMVAKTRYIVRRLTPLECERLQGYPDGWTDIGEWTDSKGKKRQTSDAARYKALGNSIAIPPWKWVLKRLCACYERDATMASLFDGIGGFPYLWEQLNGKGTCLWASEIEEFPMAVTKKRIGGD